jgi:hypothetical protein
MRGANLQASRPIDAPPERTHTDKGVSLGIRSNSHRVHIHHPRPICAASLTLSRASVNTEAAQSCGKNWRCLGDDSKVRASSRIQPGSVIRADRRRTMRRSLLLITPRMLELGARQPAADSPRGDALLKRTKTDSREPRKVFGPSASKSLQSIDCSFNGNH